MATIELKSEERVKNITATVEGLEISAQVVVGDNGEVTKLRAEAHDSDNNYVGGIYSRGVNGGLTYTMNDMSVDVMVQAVTMLTEILAVATMTVDLAAEATGTEQSAEAHGTAAENGSENHTEEGES